MAPHPDPVHLVGALVDQAVKLLPQVDPSSSHEDGALCEFKFAEESWNGYKATSAGEHAFEAVGQRMVARELFEVAARLQQLEQLRRHLNGS